MLRLHEEALITTNVKTICLPIEEQQFIENQPDEDKIGTVAGWGRNGKASSKFSDVLMQARVPYIDNDVCNNQFERKTSPAIELTEKQLVTLQIKYS